MVDPKIIDFIKKMLNKGIPIDTIKSQLKEKGWSDKDINAGIKSVVSSETPTTKIYCWNCGKENDATAKFCNDCGVNLEEIPEEKGKEQEARIEELRKKKLGELKEKAKKEKAPKEKEEEKQSRLITIVPIIGAILVGLGIIVFVASNWQKIPSFFKLILLFGTTFAVYFAGWKLEHNTHPKTGHAILFLGSLLTGATIFLTAQIFHVQANVHWLLLLWFIAVAPLSYGFDSRPTLVLSLLIFCVWMATYGKFDGAGVFLFYGLTLFGIGYLHEKTEFSEFKESYQTFGLFFTLAILYVSIVSELKMIDKLGSHWLTYVFLMLALGTVITSSFFLGKGIGKKQEFAWNLLAFIIAASLWILSLSIENISKSDHWHILIIYHIFFFVLVLLTFMSGYYQGIASFVNVGLIFFVLYIGYFYFTTIFKYLPKSLALIIGGVVLLVGGWYLEKKRRLIMKEIEER